MQDLTLLGKNGSEKSKGSAQTYRIILYDLKEARTTVAKKTIGNTWP